MRCSETAGWYGRRSSVHASKPPICTIMTTTTTTMILLPLLTPTLLLCTYNISLSATAPRHLHHGLPDPQRSHPPARPIPGLAHSHPRLAVAVHRSSAQKQQRKIDSTQAAAFPTTLRSWPLLPNGRTAQSRARKRNHPRADKLTCVRAERLHSRRCWGDIDLHPRLRHCVD